MRFSSTLSVALTCLAAGALANPVSFDFALEERQQPAVNGSATASSSATSSASASSSASSSAASAAFPTDVGYLGTTRQGAVPFLANQDKLNGSRGNSPYEYRWNATDANKEQFDIFKSMGNLSPYHSSRLFPETTAKKVLPDTCEVTNAMIFHRHGARYPTSYSTEGAPFAGATIVNATKAGNLTASGPLAFLKNFTYQLGAELLVPIGSQQLFDSGVYHYMQYGKLLNVSLGHKPVVRTPSQSRMLDSARYFTLGFFGWDAPNKINMEVQIESEGFNSTMAPYDTCNNSNTIYVGDDYLRKVWDPIYLANATERLQKYTNLNLTTTLVYGMQALCPYESAALGYSNFCDLFTEDEWKGFEYDLDLQFSGDYGPLSPSGRAQGIGYAQELLDFLSNSTFTGPVTTQNTTFDDNPAYFPVAQPLQLTFTHDDVIVSVLTALNYTQFFQDLNPKKPDPSRNFVLSEIAPFAGRLVHEVIRCSADNATYVRTVLNEAIVPMDEGQGCKEKRDDGLCKLDDFLQFQRDNAVKAANFDYACFGDYNVTGAGQILNGTIGV